MNIKRRQSQFNLGQLLDSPDKAIGDWAICGPLNTNNSELDCFSRKNLSNLCRRIEFLNENMN